MKKFVNTEMMEGNKLVLDASVALKWILDEEESEKALRLRERMLQEEWEVYVPVTFYFEVASVLAFKAPQLARDFVSMLKLDEYKEMHLNFGILDIALKLMKQCKGVSLYDAYYHAIALKVGGTFLTADKKYFNLAKKQGSVALLSDEEDCLTQKELDYYLKLPKTS